MAPRLATCLVRTALAACVCVLLVQHVRAGVTVEGVHGLYRLIRGRGSCVRSFSISNRQDIEADIFTDEARCDTGKILMDESPNASNGDSVTAHLVKQDVNEVGTVVLALVTEPVSCDGDAGMMAIQRNVTINFLRPRKTLDYLIVFKTGVHYAVLTRRTNPVPTECVFERKRSVVPGTAPATATAKESEAVKDGDRKVSMWVWLGPLIGFSVLLLTAVVVLVVMKRRESRWYPFPTGGTMDMDEAAFFGRFSNSSARKTGSLDVPRGPSGVVFEASSELSDAERKV